jgi:UPF0755 protein
LSRGNRAPGHERTAEDRERDRLERERRRAERAGQRPREALPADVVDPDAAPAQPSPSLDPPTDAQQVAPAEPDVEAADA